MNNLVFGKYLPLDTPIHRLDPRTKLLAVFLMLVSIFVPDSWYAYAFLFVFLLLTVLLAGLKLKMLIKSFKPMVFMMVSVSYTHLRAHET